MLSTPCLKLKKIASTLGNQIRSKSLFSRSLHFLFKKNLLLVNSITSGGCMALGDLIQQEIEVQYKVTKRRYDWDRIIRMFTVGTFLGPMHHYYYLYLDKFLPKADARTILKKVACDQMFASPATIVCFFLGMDILERKSFEDSFKEIKEKFKYVYVGDCLYWPPVQVINFYYLPTQYRVIYINIATMVFNIFLSFIKHYDQH